MEKWHIFYLRVKTLTWGNRQLLNGGKETNACSSGHLHREACPAGLSLGRWGLSWQTNVGPSLPEDARGCSFRSIYGFSKRGKHLALKALSDAQVFGKRSVRQGGGSSGELVTRCPCTWHTHTQVPRNPYLFVLKERQAAWGDSCIIGRTQ